VLKIVICEDNEQYLELLYGYIGQIIKANNMNAKIVLKTTSALEVQDYLKQNENDVNVFLLDIKLKNQENGYDLAEFIEQNLKNKYIVFITENLDYVFRAFKVRAFDFLPKPVTENVLEHCILKIYDDYVNRENIIEEADLITIKYSNLIYKIKKQDIILIEKEGSKTVIHTLDKRLSCYYSLDKLQNSLSCEKYFVRCHKSYIVNIKYASDINLKKKEIYLHKNKTCFIGRKYKEDVINAARC